VRSVVLFSQQTCNIWDWDLNQTSNPQATRMGCVCLFTTALSTCLAWRTLPVAMLPLAYFLISFDHTHAPPTWQSGGTIRGIVRSLQYTLHTLQYTLHTLQYTLHTLQYTLHTYLLHGAVLLEKLTISRIVKFPKFYRTRSFITSLTSAHHLSQS